MEFTHPLARKAKVWPSRNSDGGERRILVIVTTIVLNPESERFKQKLVDRLSDAAQKFLSESGAADGFLLMTRLKDWKE